MTRLSREDWERASTCDHGAAQWTEWDNLTWGEGQGECGNCGARLEDIQIRTRVIVLDDVEIENLDEYCFCKECDTHDTEDETCMDCQLCSACSSNLRVNECEDCGDPGEEE